MCATIRKCFSGRQVRNDQLSTEMKSSTRGGGGGGRPENSSAGKTLPSSLSTAAPEKFLCEFQPLTTRHNEVGAGRRLEAETAFFLPCET